jgi:ketosteroid isomerase-like protein
MSQENVEVVKRSIAAGNERDLDALQSLIHPDIEVDWSASFGPEPRIYRGLEEAAEWYSDVGGTFESVRIVPDRFIESGDFVVVPHVAQMRGRDGIQVVARSAFVYEVRGGLITRVRMYQETAEALEAVGLRA